MEALNYFVFTILAICTRQVYASAPDMTPFVKDISTKLFVTFNNETKEDKPLSVEEMMNSTRKQFLIDLFRASHYGTGSDHMLGCYFTAVTYRSAMWDLRRYFEIRWLYMNTLEFEVGYLTHEIIHRYQLVLELYNLVERKFMPHQYENYAPSNYMLYMYTNILEHCRVIIHLSNMMHELEAKYHGNMRGVFEDYMDPRRGVKKGKNVTTPPENDMAAYERYLKQQEREAKRLRRERKRYFKDLAKFGRTTTLRRTVKKKSNWPLTYGWSIENW